MNVAETYDEISVGYDEHDDTVQFLAEDKFVYEMLLQHANGRIVVDLGCGTGRAVSWLHIRPENYCGCDVSEGMLSFAKSKYPEYDFKQRDMRDVHSIRNAFVISLYGSPCYMPVSDLSRMMQKWHDADADQFYLLYGKGRNKSTYTAERDGGASPICYGEAELDLLKAMSPEFSAIGVDIYSLNKHIFDVDLYYKILVEQSKRESEPINSYAWVMVHIPPRNL